ncbi:hypothetical protein OX283_000385 [Flavobacterium sp. SUN052]|uniref:hypothetical protein n=1 Tax=Flavobacterium sp. SUN052 TaxID=3002441 RepID=UPI00237E0EF9|nr:hypothetical protein [Flavobacterium sp. SUN052]MEC4003099.1 hypothetical protein [Flavobacterium sp. SUN052]
MEPNNIENQIREKLNSREIQPTEMAWDRLDAMLSIAEEKKTKRSFGWLYIAASIFVLVSVGMFFFNQKGIVVKPENNVVVNENVIKSSSNENQNSVNRNTGIDNDGLTGFKEQVEKREKENSKTENKTIIAQSLKSFNSINQKTKVNSIKNPLNEVQNKEVIAQKELPKNEEPKTDVISNPINQNQNNAVASIQKTTPTDKKIKVNANSLLSQVDGELEQTFREKVITKISKNYQEVKVALANRNQE